MATLTSPAVRLDAAPPAPADPDGPFWCAAIGSGVTAVLELTAPIDALARCAAQLPVRPSLTRPVVGQYLSMVKTLAAAWTLHSRPALLSSMAALVHFGASVGQSFTFEAIAGCRVDQGRAAQRVVDALQRRLAAPLAAFEALGADFSSYLAQMARVSGELDADTRLVTQRLQADQVHVFLLSQQASALQAKLDDTGLPTHGCALEGLRRQLDQLRTEHAATRAEADYLQSLMPTLSPYLAAVDRMGGAIAAIAGGTEALAARLATLKLALATTPCAAAALQLDTALPHWQDVAAAAARLAPRPD